MFSVCIVCHNMMLSKLMALEASGWGAHLVPTWSAGREGQRGRPGCLAWDLGGGVGWVWFLHGASGWRLTFFLFFLLLILGILILLSSWPAFPQRKRIQRGECPSSGTHGGGRGLQGVLPGDQARPWDGSLGLCCVLNLAQRETPGFSADVLMMS